MSELRNKGVNEYRTRTEAKVRQEYLKATDTNKRDQYATRYLIGLTAGVSIIVALGGYIIIQTVV